MNRTMDNNKIMKIVFVGVFGALVFVSNYIQIPIPVAIGDVTRIHLGNALCLLSGLVLGPVGGGLAAGIGSGLFDLLNPLYITSAPFTFAFKFLMAFIAGMFMKKSQSVKSPMGIMGCIVGQLTYIALYLGKTFIDGILQGSAAEAMFPVILTKLSASLTNAVIAVIIASVLGVSIQLGRVASTRKSMG